MIGMSSLGDHLHDRVFGVLVNGVVSDTLSHVLLDYLFVLQRVTVPLNYSSTDRSTGNLE